MAHHGNNAGAGSLQFSLGSMPPPPSAGIHVNPHGNGGGNGGGVPYMGMPLGNLQLPAMPLAMPTLPGAGAMPALPPNGGGMPGLYQLPSPVHMPKGLAAASQFPGQIPVGMLPMTSMARCVLCMPVYAGLCLSMPVYACVCCLLLCCCD